MKKMISSGLLVILLLCGATLLVGHKIKTNSNAYSFSATSGISFENGKRNNLSDLGRVAQIDNGITVLMIPMEKDTGSGFYITAISDNSRIIDDVYLNADSIIFLDSKRTDITDNFSIVPVQESNNKVITAEPKDSINSDEICFIKMVANGIFNFEDAFSLTDERHKTKFFDKYQCSIDKIKVVESDSMRFLQFDMIFDPEFIKNSIVFSPGVTLTNNSYVRKAYYKSHEANVFNFECEFNSDRPTGKLTVTLPNMLVAIDTGFSQ